MSETTIGKCSACGQEMHGTDYNRRQRDRIEQLERCLLQAQNAAIALERSNKELLEALETSKTALIDWQNCDLDEQQCDDALAVIYAALSAADDMADKGE